MTAGRVLAALRDSLAAEAHVIASDPALLRQQVCNRLDRWARDDDGLRPVLEGERTTRTEPWLRRVNAPRDSEELARTIPAGQRGILQAALASNGSHLVTRGRDGTIATWDLRTGTRAELAATPTHVRVGSAEVEEPQILRFAGSSGERLAAVVAQVSRRVVVVAPEALLREVDPAEWGTERFGRRVPRAVLPRGPCRRRDVHHPVPRR